MHQETLKGYQPRDETPRWLQRCGRRPKYNTSLPPISLVQIVHSKIDLYAQKEETQLDDGGVPQKRGLRKTLA